MINDPTIPWDPTLYRPWIDPNLSQDKKPSVMILLTNFGWNNPNQTVGITYARHKRETDLFTAIVNHPLFNPTGWTDIQEHRVPILSNTRYYVFVDTLQCPDSHYPIYGAYNDNLDPTGNRIMERAHFLTLNGIASHPVLTQGALFEHPLQDRNTTAKVLIFDCTGWGPPAGFRNADTKDLPIALIPVSGNIANINEAAGDQGLVPPAPKPVHLTEKEQHDIQTCAAETNRSPCRLCWK
jgi:hypothetical protein